MEEPVTQGGVSDSPCLRALAAPCQGLEVGPQHPCWVLSNLQLHEISAQNTHKHKYVHTNEK